MRMQNIIFLSFLCILGCKASSQDNQKKTVVQEPTKQTEESTKQTEESTKQEEPNTTRPPSSEYRRNHWKVKQASSKSFSQALPATGRKARRISVNQLQKTITFLFDGITWKKGNVNMLAKLSGTLGKADYVQNTSNDLSINALFLKFMDDMAGNVCHQAVERDFANKSDKKLIVLHNNDVDKNLRFLRLKLHVLYVPPEDKQAIQDLKHLYDRTLEATSSPKQAWKLVCIKMLTSPEFLTY